MESSIRRPAGVEIDAAECEAVGSLAQHKTDSTALAVDDLGGTSFGFRAGSPSRGIVSLRPLTVGRIGNLSRFAPARLIAPSHPTRFGCQGVERRHDSPLVRIGGCMAATSEAADEARSPAMRGIRDVACQPNCAGCFGPADTFTPSLA